MEQGINLNAPSFYRMCDANQSQILYSPAKAWSVDSSCSSSVDTRSNSSTLSHYLTEKTTSPIRSSFNVISVVKKAPSAPSIEQLLDYGSAVKPTTFICSKYSEIGNPHSRKRNSINRIPTPKSWCHLESYNIELGSQKSCRPQEGGVNFMDKQTLSIYNLTERRRMDRHLAKRKPSPFGKTCSVLPPILTAGKRAPGKRRSERKLIKTIVR